MKRVVVLSLAVHVALFAWLSRTRPAAPATVVPTTVEAELELEVDVAEEAVPAAPIAAPARIEVPVVGRPVPAAPVGERGHEAGSSSSEAMPAEAAPYASNGTLIVIGPAIGIGGPNPFLRGALTQDVYPNGVYNAGKSPDPMHVPLEKRAEQSVKDALRARDQKIGLGLEGPVVRALATAKIDMRGVKRAELNIAVESEVLLPSGNKPDARVQASGKPTQTKVETNAPSSPSGADVVATVEVATFDVTDIGAKAQRVVHARLLLMTTR